MADALDLLEAQGRADREAQKAARRTPEAKAARNRGRTQRNRGVRTEREIARRLECFGFRRVIMSGALAPHGGTLAGDVRREHGVVRVLEVKRRHGAAKQWRDWLAQGDSDALVLVTGGGAEPLVIMAMGTFERWLREEANG